MSLPDIDIIIPTYNSERTLERCLANIRAQYYDGNLIVTIIDGGSNDGTKRIAEKYDVNFIKKDGMYSVGKNGARHFGESITSAPFIWNVDSDNILVDKYVAQRLIKPLLHNPELNISIPMTSIDNLASSFNNWISEKEISKVSKMFDDSYTYSEGYYYIKDISYGLTNCSLLRRDAIEKVGGYDSDVRTLDRLRRFGLSSGVIDIQSHFYHNQVDSIIQYLKKWDRRIRKHSLMTEDELKDYFVEWPPPDEQDKFLKTGVLKSLLWEPMSDLRLLVHYRNASYAWGPIYSMLLLLLASLKPFTYHKVFQKFL